MYNSFNAQYTPTYIDIA